ncbi:MAG TPA: DinB family protein [Acidimicrobiales bacterium]|nr:DinB family protein [Acidimicrobiales bacterium]
MPDERCDECGFEYKSVQPRDAVVALRSFPKRYRAPLTRLLPGEDVSLLRTRPEPTVWSALEYAAHVRDVFDAYGDRIQRTLVEDRPAFEAIAPDEMAAERRYNEQDPGVVAGELAANAEALATILDGIPDDGWDRVGFARGDERSVLYTAQRAVHEGHHHLLDIGRVMRTVRGR